MSLISLKCNECGEVADLEDYAAIEWVEDHDHTPPVATGPVSPAQQQMNTVIAEIYGQKVKEMLQREAIALRLFKL